jgi:hypothetical protein
MEYVVTPSMVQVHDVCDPSAQLVFVSGVSDQPDDGNGDGNTTNDIVVRPDAVCARAERQGMVLDGRTYTVTARLSDASSNSTLATFEISVPHDQPGSCTRGGEPVDGADERCQPTQPFPTSPATVASSSSDVSPVVTRPRTTRTTGCATTSSHSLGMIVLYVLLGRRRRRSRA